MVKIFVGNLSSSTTAEDLRSLFSDYGKVKDCDVLKNYGFVHMEGKQEAEEVVRKLHLHELKGQAINVEMSKKKPRGSTKLHVSDICSGCTNQELRAKFEEYGPVVECDIVKDYAFVHMERMEDAVEAISGLDNTTFQGLSTEIACRIIPGKWTEKTGLDLLVGCLSNLSFYLSVIYPSMKLCLFPPFNIIKGFPGQPYGNDCGIFMLMSALYIVLDAPFDYTILDMAELRKWWCVMLMENFRLEQHGKLFAHYAEESKAFLRGEQQPVFRLRKRRFEEISQEDPFHVQVDETDLFTPEFASKKQVVQSPRKVRVMTDLKTASQWCIENSRDLLGSVQLPGILCMEDEEAAEALEPLFCDEFSKDDLVEPLTFVFEFMQDMHAFLENVVDKMHLQIFCRTQN